MQDNLDSYVTGKITAGERRILLTKWVGEAWAEISSQKEMIVRSFQKTGISLPIDGSGDHLIHIEGIEDYQVESTTDEYTDDDEGDPFGDTDEDEGEDVFDVGKQDP